MRFVARRDCVAVFLYCGEGCDELMVLGKSCVIYFRLISNEFSRTYIREAHVDSNYTSSTGSITEMDAWLLFGLRFHICTRYLKGSHCFAQHETMLQNSFSGISIADHSRSYGTKLLS